MEDENVEYFMTKDHQDTNEILDTVLKDSIKGVVDRESIAKVTEMLRRHIYIEEEILFPTLPSDNDKDIEFLEVQHGEVFRFLKSLNSNNNADLIKDISKKLLDLLIEHNAFEESFIYGNFEKLDAAFIEKITFPVGWKCRYAGY
jgi:hemerythrin superfamily protein